MRKPKLPEPKKYPNEVEQRLDKLFSSTLDEIARTASSRMLDNAVAGISTSRLDVGIKQLLSKSNPPRVAQSLPSYNLVLVHDPDLFSVADYERLREIICGRAPDIAVHIRSDILTVDSELAHLKDAPTLVFCPTQLKYLSPPRGTVRCGQRIAKIDQTDRLRRANVRVPKTSILTERTRLDEREWGSHVILKPTAFGTSKGLGVELWRTGHVRYRPPIVFHEDHPGRFGPMIVQKFIPTGAYTQDYRVMTMFGEPLYALFRRQLTPMPDIHAKDFISTNVGVTTNSVSGEREVRLAYDKDVLEFARKIFKAIPEVPFQACDIRRDIDTGLLYCLEINPGGNTWNFSSKKATARPTFNGIRREDQFGAFNIMADTLARETRRLAS